MGEEKGPNARRPSTLRCRSSSTSTSHLLIQTTTKQPIVSLNAQDTVAQALSTLSAARILSAPLVVGPPSLAFEGRPPVNSVAAFVGVADVVDALLDALPLDEAEGEVELGALPRCLAGDLDRDLSDDGGAVGGGYCGCCCC